MHVIICSSPEEAADLVAREILDALSRKPDLVLGLATGSTPIRVYDRLLHAHQEDGADFSGVRTFNLDEYIGLPPAHPHGYRTFMHDHLFGGSNFTRENIHFPPTEGPDLVEKCTAFEAKIRDAGGIDIQILGIGSNGHIGFNEPTSSLASRTRITSLTEKTLRDNAPFFDAGEPQPSMAVTMGIGTILDARRILVQAFGLKKAEAVRQSVEGPVSSFFPGSALQLHANVTFHVDAEASSRLTMQAFYRRSQENVKELEAKNVL